MILRDVIDVLEQIRQLHGDTIEVVVVHDDEEWPFGVHVEPEMMNQFPRMLVCLDTTSPGTIQPRPIQ